MSSGQHSQTRIPVDIEELKIDFIGPGQDFCSDPPSAGLREIKGILKNFNFCCKFKHVNANA